MVCRACAREVNSSINHYSLQATPPGAVFFTTDRRMRSGPGPVL
jgi:hypothetical protein